MGAVETFDRIVVTGKVQGYRMVRVTLPGRGSFTCNFVWEAEPKTLPSEPHVIDREAVCRPNS